MAGHSRLSLSAYGGYAVVLNNPGNRYAKAAESYLAGFFPETSTPGAYSSKSIEILKDNIRANNAIINQQRKLWEEIEEELDGKSLIDFLLEKQVGSAVLDDDGQKTAEVYNSPKKLKEFTNNLTSMQTIEKDLIARTQRYESTYRDVLKQLSTAVGNLSTPDDINLVVAEVKKIGEQIVGKLDQAFVEKTAATLAHETLGASFIGYLQDIYESLEGSSKDTIAFEDGQLVLTGDASKISEQTQRAISAAIQNYKTAIAGVNTYQMTSTRFKGNFADFDITKLLKTSVANARKMKDTVNGHANYIKQFVLTYHELVKLLEQAQQEIKKQKQQQLRQTQKTTQRRHFQRQVKKGILGHSTVFHMMSPADFYSTTGAAQELSMPIIKEDVQQREFSDAEYNTLWEGGSITDNYHIQFDHTGDDLTRPIVSQPGGINYTDAAEITKRIRKMGQIVQNLMADSPSLLKSHSHALANVKGKLDSIITLTNKQGKTYRIAFSDKLYNAGGLKNIAISGGNLLTNLVSLTSNTDIDTHALFVVLLNLSSVAACYSEERRDQINTLLQTLLSQNFTALAFDTSNNAYEDDNTLYISNYSGSIVPLYSALTALNNYISMTLAGMNSGSKITSPVKVEIQYADNLGSGTSLWEESMRVAPPIFYDDGTDLTKQARWDYVASTVAAATQTRISFDMIAFNNLYNGFF